MKTTVVLTGMKELEKKMAELPLMVNRRTLGQRALRAGGEPIARAARQMAPVLTGALRESIDVKATLAPSQRGDTGMVAPLEMHVGPGQHPQAITQEFGTYFSPPHPFMRPAWDAHHLEALDLIGAVLWAEVEKTAK